MTSETPRTGGGIPVFLIALLAVVAGAVVTGQIPWQALVTLVLFFVILGVLVLVHELGHFIVARLAGVRVLEFGLGFPPRAKVLRDRGETVYTLNWLPIGGFVKLEGEEGDADDPRSFAAQRLPTKVLILVAGVVMNFLLAFAIFAGVALTGDPAQGVYVPYVDPTSPAATAGIHVGDVIEKVDGRAFAAFGPRSILDDLSSKAGRTVTLRILRPDGTQADVRVTLRTPQELRANPNLGALGIGRREQVDPATGAVTVPGVPIEFRPIDEKVFYPAGTAVKLGVDRTIAAARLIFGAVGDLVANFVTRPTEPPTAAGPIGIAGQIGDVFFTAGPIYTLVLAGLISANLGVINILPLPPLDGGRVLVIVLKRLIGGRLTLRAERLTYFVGFALLFGFLIWVSAFDLARQFGGTR